MSSTNSENLNESKADVPSPKDTKEKPPIKKRSLDMKTHAQTYDSSLLYESSESAGE